MNLLICQSALWLALAAIGVDPGPPPPDAGLSVEQEGAQDPAQEGAEEPDDSDEQPTAADPKRRKLLKGRGPAVGLPQRSGTAERARALVASWRDATYVIMQNGQELGTYTQRNTMANQGGGPLIEFRDYFSIPNNKFELRFQSVHRLDDDLSLKSLVGTRNDEQMNAKFADGRVSGKGMGQVKLDLEVPHAFLTKCSLLRGLNELPRRKNQEMLFNFVVVDEMPDENSVHAGVMRCLGKDDVVLEGKTYNAWKYRWSEDGGPKVYLWFGASGQFLKLVNGKEEWTYSATRSNAAASQAPPVGQRGAKKATPKGGRRDRK